MTDRPITASSRSYAGDWFEFDMFGGFVVRRASDNACFTPRSRKARALLAYLVLEHKPVSRDRLAGLLWSLSGQTQAFASLRQCMLELKPFRVGSPPLLSIDRHSASVIGPLQIDLDRMMILASAGEIDALTEALSRGETLLEDLDGIDPEMDRWLRGIRTTRGEALMVAAEQACQAALARGEDDSAFCLARQLQRIDPLNEMATRLAMEAAQAAGHTGSEHRAYERLCHDLHEELGVEPAPETRGLHLRLSTREADSEPGRAPARADVALPASAPPSFPRAQTQLVPAGPDPPRDKSRWRVLIGLVVALLLSGGALYVQSRSPTRVPTVAVQGESGPASENMARDMAIDLARLASARASEISLLDPNGDARPDYVVRVGVKQAGERLAVNLALLETGHPELLWTTAFDRPAGELRNLRQEANSRAGAVLFCAMDALDNRAGLARATLKLFISACDRINDAPDDSQIDLLRQVTQRAPRFASGWALLALAEAAVGSTWDTNDIEDTPRKQALRRAARIHLSRARALDPSLGATYLAEAALTPPGRWARLLEIIDAGLAVDPDHAGLHARRSDALASVGRMKEAAASAARAAQFDPLTPAHRSLLVSRLAYSGNLVAARQELEKAEQVWPEADAIREVRFRLDLRYGDPAAALRLADELEVTLPGHLGVWRGPAGHAFARARIDPTPENIDASIRWFERTRHDRARVFSLFQALVLFGRIEEAFRLCDAPSNKRMILASTEPLFRDQMAAFRHDPRFMVIVARIGLLDYWQSTGSWPDFCSDPKLPYDCRAVARAIASRRKS